MSAAAEYARALLARAADDRYVVELLARSPDAPLWVLGFHAQQAVEKAIKGVLASHQIEFPRTHNLAMLLEMARRAAIVLPPDGDDLARLIPFGVALRYEDATSDDGPDLDSGWALDVVTRTLKWADDAITRPDHPFNQED
ncbi:HEPN domain-containing protein [Methylolobus aquaticus]